MGKSKELLQEVKRLIKFDRSQSGRRVRYSSKVKGKIRELSDLGLRVVELSELTGISVHSIRQWIKQTPTSKVEESFRPVSVSAEDETFVLVFPNGVMVKGMTFEQLMEMVDDAASA